MKGMIRLFSFVALGLYSLSGMAADGVDFDSISSAAKRSGDLSRQALVMIFGDVVNNPLSPTNTSMIGELFFVLNSIIATIAMFWFLSVTLRQTVRAGNQGQVFSSGRTMMFPVTTLAGFITLVPTPSGWSISQLVVLWAASIMGVGSANMLTDRAADMLQGGKSLVMQPIAPQTLSASRAIFEMNLCMYGINDELNTMYSESGDAGTKLMSISSLNDGYEIGNGSAQCGSARLPVTQKSSSWIPLFDVPVNVESLIAAQKNALNQMQNRLSQSAYNFVSEFRQKQRSGEGNIADVESEVQEAARQYEETVSQAAQAMDNESSLQDLVAQQLKQYGWLALGSWYQTFATANSKTNAVVTMSPTVSGISGLGEIGAGSLYNQLAMAYRAQLQNNTYSAPLGTQKSKDTQLVSNATDSSAVLVSMTNSWGQDLINKIANINFGSNNDSSDQVNPLLKMKAIGDYTLVGAQTVFTVYTGAKALLYWSKGNNVGAIGAKVVNGLSGAGDVAEGILDAISPVVYFLLFILFSIGFSLSIYLPFIPFIYWISAATNWVVGVIVGAMSGSLWSATHLGSEEDKGSRSAYGYIFLIDVMLRPMLMVFGFFFASLVIVAIGTLLNLLLASAIANVQADSITGLVSIVGILMIYARICTTLVSRAFSLQVTMPDYVISWLGGREGASMLNGMADSVKNMFAGFGSGSGRTPNAKKIVSSAGEGNNDNGVK
ncbi:DotA/TraY family protein [Yersinia similis]|uniref:DotA/TraY family protein n=1 Tax=Yersinia similis TaxID=367190 RepID=UPI00061C7354|nr:DotA/TraY family protein [Yersinia similis]CNB82465.1 type IV secretion system protein DotA-like protein [Yersinia similis]